MDADHDFDTVTVEAETMLLALAIAGEGMTNEEIAIGLLETLSYFAECSTDKASREGIADLLGSLADDLRTKDPIDMEAKPWMQPQGRAAFAASMLAMAQEGREP